MTDTQRIVQIDPTRLVSELTVGELLKIIEVTGAKLINATRVCVNFGGFNPRYFSKSNGIRSNVPTQNVVFGIYHNRVYGSIADMGLNFSNSNQHISGPTFNKRFYFIHLILFLLYTFS